MTVVYRFLDATFEWDEHKAETNLTKHGVSFVEAVEVFADPNYLIGDASTGPHEDRSYVLGMTLASRLLLVVHTERGTRIRIVSARLATKAETRIYERSTR